jgi:hypothetical protein
VQTSASESVTIAQASRALDRSPATIRRWIAAGAPTVSLGKEGRGNGSRVNVKALAHWRSKVEGATTAEVLHQVARSLKDVQQRNAVGFDVTAARLLGLSDHVAAALLVEVFERIALTMTAAIPDPLPADIQHLVDIVKTETAR